MEDIDPKIIDEIIKESKIKVFKLDNLDNVNTKEKEKKMDIDTAKTSDDFSSNKQNIVTKTINLTKTLKITFGSKYSDIQLALLADALVRALDGDLSEADRIKAILKQQAI